MHTPLNVDFVQKNRLPLSPSYLLPASSSASFSSSSSASAAAPVGVTVYQYIRDHLGYRIELVSLNVVGNATIIIRLKNYGFSTPVNVRILSVVLIDRNSSRIVWNATTHDVNGGDWRKWQPYAPGDPLRTILTHTFASTGSVVFPIGTYDVGVSLRDSLEKDCLFINAVQFANQGMQQFKPKVHVQQTESMRGGATARVECYNGTSIVGQLTF
jgi:hypothetical protein